MTDASLELLNQIAQIVYEKKGGNILALNVHGLSSITDYLVIAEGDVATHVRAIGSAIMELLGNQNLYPLRTEGVREGDWVILDYGEVMVHLFKPGLRDKYSLEHLWPESQLIELNVQPIEPLDF